MKISDQVALAAKNLSRRKGAHGADRHRRRCGHLRGHRHDQPGHRAEQKLR